MNEAAILAARRGLKEISKEEVSDALERIVAGPEKKGAVMTDRKKRLVAYHEAGAPPAVARDCPLLRALCRGGC
jgi:cell division protease FtsH